MNIVLPAAVRITTMFWMLLPVFLLHSINWCQGEGPAVNTSAAAVSSVTSLQLRASAVAKNELVPCTCGIFLTGQFVKGSHQQPFEGPALTHEHELTFPCSPFGRRQCANKCLEVIAKHLPSSATIICGSIDRDCFKERAYLWTKNCKDVWENSKMSAGREYCCKNGLPYKCSLGKQ